MACEICGRNSCTKSFHSLEEQSEHDNIADAIKDRIKERIKRRCNRLTSEYVDDDRYVKLDDVINIIDDEY